MISKMFSSDKDVSSKRIIGAFCIAIYIGLLIGTFIGLHISQIQADAMNTMFYGGIVLIGAGTFENIKLR